MFNPVTIEREHNVIAVRILGRLVYGRVGNIAEAFGGAYRRIGSFRYLFGIHFKKPKVPQWLRL